MAIRGNIGKISAAIEEGRKAFQNVDFGPVIPDAITSIEDTISDWQAQVIDPSIFVFGVHKWAYPTLKVTA